MSYYRLIKETDTQIHLSTEGMEIPGAECVSVEYHESLVSFIETLVKTHTIIFENGRTIRANVIMSRPKRATVIDDLRTIANVNRIKNTEFIFEKCRTTDS